MLLQKCFTKKVCKTSNSASIYFQFISMFSASWKLLTYDFIEYAKGFRLFVCLFSINDSQQRKRISWLFINEYRAKAQDNDWDLCSATIWYLNNNWFWYLFKYYLFLVIYTYICSLIHPCGQVGYFASTYDHPLRYLVLNMYCQIKFFWFLTITDIHSYTLKEKKIAVIILYLY